MTDHQDLAATEKEKNIIRIQKLITDTGSNIVGLEGFLRDADPGSSAAKSARKMLNKLKQVQKMQEQELDRATGEDKSSESFFGAIRRGLFGK